jgi:hypothetical protein
MKLEKFPVSKVSDNSRQKELDDNQGRNIKKANFLKNLKIAGVISLGMLAASENVFSQEKNRKDKKGLKEHELFSPAPSWKFQDSHSIEAQNDSPDYPGFVENYLKHEDDTYEFYQYTDEHGNVLETPDSLREVINSEEEELAKYANPEEWAKEKFAYQKTPEFMVAILQKYVADMEVRIKDLKDKMELLADLPSYSAEEKKSDEHNINVYTESVAYFKEHPEELSTGKEKTIEELVQEAKSYRALIQSHIDKYQKELDYVVKYIEQNKK